MTGSTGTTTLVLVVLLVALGLAMVATAVWLVRTTRSDAPALGPLEAMSSRRWARGDADRRAADLAAARPDGALPPAPMLEPDPVLSLEIGPIGPISEDGTTSAEVEPVGEPESS